MATPSDAEPIDAPKPLFRVNPDYPREAQAAGIEGFVALCFTIRADGTVADIKIADSQPPGVFDRTVLRAFSQWRYQPFEKDGTAYDRRNVYIILRLKLH